LKQINVTIPSITVLKSCVYDFPKELSNEQLIRKYGQLKAANSAWINGKLPLSYYALSMYGRIPKDASTLAQLSSIIKEYEEEIEKRNLFENFELTISIVQSKNTKENK